MKSCLNCIHWKKFDLSKITWQGEPPNCECDISDIESQFPDPRKIVEAALVSREAKLFEAAAQCPHFQFVSADQQPAISSAPKHAPLSSSDGHNENFFRDAAEDLVSALGRLVTEKPEFNHGYRQGTGLGAPAPGEEVNN